MIKFTIFLFFYFLLYRYKIEKVLNILYTYIISPSKNIQSVMSSSAGQYFQNSQYYPHHYTPMINVPTTNRLPSHGELVASVELLIAHVTQLTNRLEKIESTINDNLANNRLEERMTIAERGINALKTCHNENDTKIASTNIELDYAFDAIKCANERIIDNEKVIDRISDILTEHDSKLRHAKQRSRDNAKKCAEIGILRRRVSKVEEFNTEFVECFETPEYLRGIVTQMSDQVEDCDRTLTYMTRYGCGGGCAGSAMELPRADDYDEEDRLEASKNVEEYFANYGEKEEGKEDREVKEEEEEKEEKDTNVEEEDKEDDDEFEKL